LFKEQHFITRNCLQTNFVTALNVKQQSINQLMTNLEIVV